jgi:glycosyltransferase involved in cell wall biosynthesis
MKPLVIVTTFNRKWETIETLGALARSIHMDTVDTVIVDNGSTDETVYAIREWTDEYHDAWDDPVYEHYLDKNIGCPQALNYALVRHRKPGQSVVKLDNDVRLLTPDWVERIQRSVTERVALCGPVAMVGAYYGGVLDKRVSSLVATWGGDNVYQAYPIVGHAVWHTGAFMDAVGYFDVLSEEHLYGFEDLIMSHKARLMGWDTLVWAGWRIENLQRHNSLGDLQDNHVSKMRPLYNRRVAALECGGPIWTGPDGRPGKDEEVQ